jgi:hypothetical protein
MASPNISMSHIRSTQNWYESFSLLEDHDDHDDDEVREEFDDESRANNNRSFVDFLFDGSKGNHANAAGSNHIGGFHESFASGNDETELFAPLADQVAVNPRTLSDAFIERAYPR